MKTDSAFSPRQTKTFHHALQDWYKQHGRHDLPWRNTRDPYAIYLSEIMLQQTQVKTVLERYYTPFLKKFPTLRSLAKAQYQAVSKQWEGLGYYTRAANLHATAKQCNGILPHTVEALHALPGIGRNTAHAIACFAFGQAVPVMEANVRRVLCRVFALKKADEQLLWKKAQLLLDHKKPFDYNQAMMDVGALICTRTKPRCNNCPLNTICRGKTSPASYPTPKQKKATPVHNRIIVALQDEEGKYHIHKRETRFLNGLFGFPEYAPDTDSITDNNTSVSLGRASLIGQITQAYSHFTLQAAVHHVRIHGDTQNKAHRATLEEMHKLPLSRADHKVVALLSAKNATPKLVS